MTRHKDVYFVIAFVCFVTTIAMLLVIRASHTQGTQLEVLRSQVAQQQVQIEGLYGAADAVQGDLVRHTEHISRLSQAVTVQADDLRKLAATERQHWLTANGWAR